MIVNLTVRLTIGMAVSLAVRMTVRMACRGDQEVLTKISGLGPPWPTAGNTVGITTPFAVGYPVVYSSLMCCTSCIVKVL